MSDRLEDALVVVLVSLPPLIAAIAAWIQSRIATRKVDDLTRAVNGRLDEVVVKAERAARAEGRLEEIEHPSRGDLTVSDRPQKLPPGGQEVPTRHGV